MSRPRPEGQRDLREAREYGRLTSTSSNEPEDRVIDFLLEEAAMDPDPRRKKLKTEAAEWLKTPEARRLTENDLLMRQEAYINPVGFYLEHSGKAP